MARIYIRSQYAVCIPPACPSYCAVRARINGDLIKITDIVTNYATNYTKLAWILHKLNLSSYFNSIAMLCSKFARTFNRLIGN